MVRPIHTMYTKSHMTDKQGILFFVKYPKVGHVKSRLGKDLDPNFIKQLYQCFVTDLLKMLKKTKIPFIICYEPPQYKTHFKQWLGEDYLYIPQIGMDLGERLCNGFKDGFNLGFTHLLVIGSDSPDLDQTYIFDAFHHLASHDVVIGPSSDGGYYLLALKTDSFLPQFFDSIHWRDLNPMQRISSLTGFILSRYPRLLTLALALRLILWRWKVRIRSRLNSLDIDPNKSYWVNR